MQRVLSVALLLSVIGCGASEDKGYFSIGSIALCQELDGNNQCATSTSTFANGTSRVFATASIKLEGKTGDFLARWSSLDGAGDLGSSTTTVSKEGTGVLSTDVYQEDGLPAGDYRLVITFDDETSKSESADFTVE